MSQNSDWNRKMHDHKERTRFIERARRYLEAAGRPRLVMLAVLCITLAAGFLSSVAMVHLGVYRMPVRYPLAVAIAYGTFLGMLWVWLQQQTIYSGLSDDPEGLLVPGVAFLGAAAMGKDLASTDLAVEEGRQRQVTGNGGVGNLSGIGGDLSGIGDIGEGLGALVILVLIAGICTFVVSVYLVVTSPLLLAELLVDGVLLGAMSRAVSPSSPPHWSRAVVRRTWLAALVTAIVFGLVGFGIERVAPGAHTLAEAWAAEQGGR
jgi:hypothetical protein